MRTVTKYIPFDESQEFDHRNICEAYEAYLRKLLRGCHFFSSCNEEFHIREESILEDLDRAYNEAELLKFDSIESRECLRRCIGFASEFEGRKGAYNCLSYHCHAEDDEWTKDNYESDNQA